MRNFFGELSKRLHHAQKGAETMKLWDKTFSTETAPSEQLRTLMDGADAIVVGAGAGLSTAAGFPKKRLFYTQGAERRVLFLELGVGANTPGIIKYPFWRMTAANKNACYVAINPVEQLVPDAIAARALTLACGIDAVV